MLSQMQSAGIKSKAKKPKKKYKMKTHSGCKKRFKVNGKGEIRHWHANKAHLNRNKRNANLRGLKGSVLLSGHMVKKIRRALCL